ncbi:acyl-CoA thioesterase [Zunongwangia endophytica]|uniref:Acyl-CoA thioesterase n=1 Tax=Zunongwangia endophytica TaxID=1808945 RepID=A0ABV8HEU1_9FLAO|nr:thioesterase family protein [Zunongwangia endophytica]MDN3593399.1 thioesterase family protein [Zunongwangia endophytica]
MITKPQIFQLELKVTESDLDDQNHVNNVQYVQWIQDVAKGHWEDRASVDQKKEYFWVVVRHEIDYKQQAFLDDDILLQTYVDEITNVTSIRHVLIKDKNTDKILVKAQTTWCLLKHGSNRPVRIDEDMKLLFQETSD